MSEETKKYRSLNEVRNEYTQVCAKLGHLQYQLYILNKDVAMVNKTLEDLNFEASAASAREAEAAKEAPKAVTAGEA